MRDIQHDTLAKKEPIIRRSKPVQNNPPGAGLESDISPRRGKAVLQGCEAHFPSALI